MGGSVGVPPSTKVGMGDRLIFECELSVEIHLVLIIFVLYSVRRLARNEVLFWWQRFIFFQSPVELLVLLSCDYLKYLMRALCLD